MKPIYTILTVLALLVVSSCYEDKGNYDYQPYHRVLVEVDNNYGIKQPEEAIEYTITPKVTLSNGSTDLSDVSFLWKMDRRTNQGCEKFGETVSTGQSVTITIDPNDTKTFSYNYYFRFYVTDNQTGVTDMYPVNLKLIKPFENSWIVLHDIDGHAELGSVEYANGAMIVTPDALTRERAKNEEIKQEPLTGKSVALGRRQVALSSYDATNWLGLITNTQLYVSTTNQEESGLLNQAENFILAGNWEHIIYPGEIEGFGSDDVSFGNSYQAGFLCSHGKVFQGCMYSVLMYGMYPDNEVAAAGDYYVEKAYPVPTAGIAFDSKNHRFLKLNIQSQNSWSGSTHTGAAPSKRGTIQVVPNNPKNAADPSAVNPDLKLVDFTAGYWYGKSLMAAWQRMAVNAYLLNENTGKSSVYVFHGYPMTNSSDPDDIPVTNLYSIDTPAGVTTHTPMTSSWEYSNILFYAVGNKIYKLDFAVTGGSSTVVYQHPNPNAEISCLQMAYEEALYVSDMPDGAEIYGHPYERTMAAGVNLPDGTGEVVVLQLNTAGKVDNDTMYPAIQEHKGFGKIKDVTFI